MPFVDIFNDRGFMVIEVGGETAEKMAIATHFYQIFRQLDWSWQALSQWIRMQRIKQIVINRS
jgi:hypothetical protein